MMRRAALLAAVLLSGCATTPGPEREGDLTRAIRECRERGGVLVPFDGATTGRVETDYACQFTGPVLPSRDRRGL